MQRSHIGGRGGTSSGLGRVYTLVPWAFTILVFSLLPTMAWGLGGRLFTVPYPSDWKAARATTTNDPLPGRILVLPWHPHLPLSWNRQTTTLNPAGSFFSRQTLMSDRLELRSGTLPAESRIGRRADGLVRSDLAMSEVMRRTGARYLLLMKDADWRNYRRRVIGLESVLDGRTMALYRLGGTIDGISPHPPWTPGVITADMLAVAGFVVMGVIAIRGRQPGGGATPRRPIAGAPDIVHAHEGGGP